MMSHIKVHSLTTYHISLAEFGKPVIEIYALELTMVFEQRLAHLPSSWLINQATSLPNAVPSKNLTLGTNRDPCGRHHGVCPIGKSMTISKIAFDDIKEAFSC